MHTQHARLTKLYPVFIELLEMNKPLRNLGIPCKRLTECSLSYKQLHRRQKRCVRGHHCEEQLVARCQKRNKEYEGKVSISWIGNFFVHCREEQF